MFSGRGIGYFSEEHTLGGISLSMSGCKTIEGQFFSYHMTLLFQDYFASCVKPYWIHRADPAAQACTVLDLGQDIVVFIPNWNFK